MKLRWSNGRDYAEPFSANDLETFLRNGIPALRVFRAATYRKVHRGEIHQDELWFDKAELHLEIEGRWMHPGLIKQSDTGSQYFEPFQTRFSLSAPDLDAIHESDRQTLAQFGEVYWQGVYGCWRWAGAMHDLITDISDKIEKQIDEDGEA